MAGVGTVGLGSVHGIIACWTVERKSVPKLGSGTRQEGVQGGVSFQLAICDEFTSASWKLTPLGDSRNDGRQHILVRRLSGKHRTPTGFQRTHAVSPTFHTHFPVARPRPSRELRRGVHHEPDQSAPWDWAGRRND